MKILRHNKILELIKEYAIDRQEDLLLHLKAAGFDVTQATVSRDIRELKLVKSTTGGKYRYTVSTNMGKNNNASSKFETIFTQSVIGVDYAGHTVLVKCFTGMANAACEVFDSVVWADVVGTLSGDDTFLVLMRTEDAAKKITKQISKYIAY